LALSGINVAEFYGGLNYEIGIEISPDKLREYGLTFRDVANAVRASSANMSAGQIRAENGYISMRVENQAYRGNEFERLPLMSLPDGSQILLGDVATVNDGFQEGIQFSRFNGDNSRTFFIGASENQDITKVAAVVDEYLAKKANELPEGVVLESFVDLTYYLEGRLNMMLENMAWGGLLVILCLALFLRVKLAFWVMMGLPVSFLGGLLFMPLGGLDITINIVSLFAFILVLGIVVDDAIVIGESAHSEIEKYGHTTENVIRGVKRVAVPATFGVLTTIAAFLPLMFETGSNAAFAKSIGGVIILCLIFSLIESKLILPAHLAKMKLSPHDPKKPLHRMRAALDGALKRFINNSYRPMIKKFIEFRYPVIFAFIGLMIISGGLLSGGFVKFVANPKIPNDFANINIEMEQATAESTTLETLLQVEQIILEEDKLIEQEYGQKMVEGISVRLEGRTNAFISTKLVDPDLRPLDTFQLSARWRSKLPDFAAVKTLTIQDSIGGNERDDGDISFRLEGKNINDLKLAASELKAHLNTIVGVGDVNDSMQIATDEVQFELKPVAYSLGLTLADVASQVSFSFYGLEAQRILRDGEEVRVMIRYPENQRNAISSIQDVRIITPQGAEVLLSEIANVKLVDGVSSIRRENARRTINVWASIDPEQVEPFKVANTINDEYIPTLLENYPGVTTNLTGRVQEEMDSIWDQLRNFTISLLVIYSLLAIPLRSYSQPLLIMSVIPFGVIGAMFGHMVLGMTMSGLSLFGIIAAAGVVVNDSLVMVDFVNKARAEGIATKVAVVEAGCKRFRAILLTSATTFIGLIPILSETSLQAKLVVPMAVSLAFGVLFATVITLILIPCQYVMFEDIKGLFRRKKSANISPPSDNNDQVIANV
jgi:multidrug efflux pump subunit AcrB